MYDQKAASVAAYIITMMPEKAISHLQLMRLMYLAEREGIRCLNHLIIIDDFYSYPETPALKNTYKVSKNLSKSSAWRELVVSSSKQLSLKPGVNSATIKDINGKSKEVIEKIITKFGKLNEVELKSIMIEECPEWERNTSSISIESIVISLNKPPVFAEHLKNIKSSIESLYD